MVGVTNLSVLLGVTIVLTLSVAKAAISGQNCVNECLRDELEANKVCNCDAVSALYPAS